MSPGLFRSAEEEIFRQTGKQCKSGQYLALVRGLGKWSLQYGVSYAVFLQESNLPELENHRMDLVPCSGIIFKLFGIVLPERLTGQYICDSIISSYWMNAGRVTRILGSAVTGSKEQKFINGCSL